VLPLRDIIPSRTTPWITLMLIVVNAAVFLRMIVLGDGAREQFVLSYGFIPASFSWGSAVTSMFLHAGWIHVAGNLWALWLFGDNVEDRMGPIRFVGFYLLCGIAAGVVHIITNPQSTVPALGASGAISGVMAAYVVLYPRARILAVFPIIIYPLFFQVPAVLYIGIWFLMQFFSGTAAIFSGQQAGGIAWWAHIGGFIAGLLTVWIFIQRPRPRPGLAAVGS